MLDKSTLIKVTNRGKGSVGYTIPELNVRRHFNYGEIKEIPMQELRQLSYLPGGQVLLKNSLLIHNEEALKELNPDYEPEYFYTEEDVKNLLLMGTQAQFLDCLDFAPGGVIELIKSLAVKLEINDLAKREAIFEKTGFNVTKAIEINKLSEIVEEEEIKTRRTIAPTVSKSEPEVVGRRTAAPTGKYTIKTK